MGHLEVLGKDVPMSFPHGTYFADSKMVERHKLRARSVFQENLAFPLNVQKYIGKTGAYVFLSMKKMMPQICIL